MKLQKASRIALEEIAHSMPMGVKMFAGSRLWCPSSRQTTATMKDLLGRGLANVIDARLVLADAGAEWLRANP